MKAKSILVVAILSLSPCVAAGHPYIGYLLTPDPAGRYSLCELGAGVIPRDISDSGTVIGYVEETGYQPFQWTSSGGLAVLPTSGAQPAGIANGINNSGVIVGESFPEPYKLGRALLWSSSGIMQDLGTLGGDGAAALAINERGQVAGVSAFTGHHTLEPFLWDSTGGMQWLGSPGDGNCYVRGINDLGQVVGSSSDIATIWTDCGGTIALGKLNPSDIGSMAAAINNAGQVVGWSRPGTDHPDQPFIWTPDEGMLELGSLYEGAAAYGINDEGTVVGSSFKRQYDVWMPYATVWRNGVATDLNTLVTLDGTYVLSVAAAINNAGQIVAVAAKPPTGPAQSPALRAALLGTIGVGCLGIWRRRHRC